MTSTRRLGGLFSVTVTPFGPDGALDLSAFVTILEWHIAQGSAGLAIAADNGEASLLTVTERQAMAETAVRVAAGRVPVVMGAMGTHAFTAGDTIKMVEVAATAGVDAVLVGPAPYIGTSTRAEVVQRYRDIYRAVNLPVIAYNNPGHFGVAVEGDTLQQLVDEIDLVGIKESSRQFLDVSKGIARFGDRISIFMGCGYLLMPGLALGAAGVLSTGVDLFGRDAARIVDLARGPGLPGKPPAASERRPCLHLPAGNRHAAGGAEGVAEPAGPACRRAPPAGPPLGRRRTGSVAGLVHRAGRAGGGPSRAPGCLSAGSHC